MSKKTNIVWEKKIAGFLPHLPEKRLFHLVKTREQCRMFFAVRHMQILSTWAWVARFTGKNDPLQPLLKSGEIDSDTYERVWLAVDFLEQLWGLVQVAEPFFKLEFKKRMKLNYPFDTSFDLFTTIVREQTNSKFSICLKRYHEVSADKYEKAYKLSAKGCREHLKLREYRQLQGLLNQHQSNLWMEILITVCHQKATNRQRVLKSKLEMFYLALANLCEKEASVRRKTNSFAWKDGEILTGTRNSTYKSS